MISLKLLMIVSVAETVDVVEVHTQTEYQALDCYIYALVLLKTLMK